MENEFIYHGIVINENTCKVPYSYIISKINDIVDQLEHENNVSEVLKNGSEMFSLYGYGDEYIVTHIYDSKISFSKINECNELINVTDKDILSLAEQEQLFRLSRSVNRYAGAYQRNEITSNQLFQSNRLIREIQSKDCKSSNLHQIKDILLKNNGKRVVSEEQLKNSLSKRLQDHKGDYTDNLKRLVNKARAYERVQNTHNINHPGEATRIIENSSLNSLKTALNTLHSITQSLDSLNKSKDETMHNR